MSRSSVLTAYVFLDERKSSFIGSQLLSGLVGLIAILLSISSEGEPTSVKKKKKEKEKKKKLGYNGCKDY